MILKYDLDSRRLARSRNFAWPEFSTGNPLYMSTCFTQVDSHENPKSAKPTWWGFINPRIIRGIL